MANECSTPKSESPTILGYAEATCPNCGYDLTDAEIRAGEHVSTRIITVEELADWFVRTQGAERCSEPYADEIGFEDRGTFNVRELAEFINQHPAALVENSASGCLACGLMPCCCPGGKPRLVVRDGVGGWKKA